MIEKTFKGKLKKAGLYTLCYSPVVIAIGCLGFALGGACVSSSYGDKKEAIYNEIYPEILMTEEFKEYKLDKEEKLVSALQDGVITIGEFTEKSQEVTNKYNVMEFAKTLPEFSAQVELAEEYYEKGTKWCHSLCALFGFTGFGFGSVFSVGSTFDYRHHNFDKEKDIEKQKKRLQAKQEKLAKKEKAL